MSFANLRKELERNRTEIRRSYGTSSYEEARRRIFEAHTQVMTYYTGNAETGRPYYESRILPGREKGTGSPSDGERRHSLRSYEADRSMELDLITEDLKRTPPEPARQDKLPVAEKSENSAFFGCMPEPEYDYFQPKLTKTLKPVSPPVDETRQSPLFNSSKGGFFENLRSFGGGGGQKNEDDEEEQPQKKGKSRDRHVTKDKLKNRKNEKPKNEHQRNSRNTHRRTCQIGKVCKRY